MATPSYTRMQVDQRRAQLLELGRRLFAEHSYDELSMTAIAAQAGITKAALYHYFPSKEAYFQETLRAAAEEIATVTEPDPELAPLEALRAGLDAYIGWIEQNPLAFRRLIGNAAAVPGAGELVDEVREQSAKRILTGLTGSDAPPEPALRIAVISWLWLMDGAILDWLPSGDLAREELRDYLLGALAGCVAAAGRGELLGAGGSQAHSAEGK